MGEKEEEEEEKKILKKKHVHRNNPMGVALGWNNNKKKVQRRFQFKDWTAQKRMRIAGRNGFFVVKKKQTSNRVN